MGFKNRSIQLSDISYAEVSQSTIVQSCGVIYNKMEKIVKFTPIDEGKTHFSASPPLQVNSFPLAIPITTPHLKPCKCKKWIT